MLLNGSANSPPIGIRSKHIKRSTEGEISWSQARELAASLVAIGPSEIIPLADSDNRVLARDHFALVNLPSFDNSAMDGWAVSGSGPWQVTRELIAGVFPDWTLAPGQACTIATGAPIPIGTTAIIRSEHGQLIDGQLHATREPSDDIRREGEECRVGDLIIGAHARLTPSALGVLGATGHDHLEVYVRPKVHILVFGDELVFRGIPKPGQIRDSLGPQLPGWLDRMGAQISGVTHCTDSLDAVRQELEKVDCDIVITTGGTAAGPRDFLRAVLQQLGAVIHIDGVHVRPGHPMMLATILRHQQLPVIGLPGNPLSAIVGLLTLAQPLINSALGLPLQELESMVSADNLYTKDGTRLIAGFARSGEFHVSEFNGSAMLRGLSHSTGFAVIEEDVAAGHRVSYLPLPHN